MWQILSILLSISYTALSQSYENTQETTLLWTLISTSQNMQLHGFIIEHPSVLMLRSEDGRGAIWWAWEYKNAEALAILAVNGVDLHYSQTDNNGQKPHELCDTYDETLQEAQSMIEQKKMEKEAIKLKIEEEKQKMYLNEQDEDDDDDDDDDMEEDEDDDDEFSGSSGGGGNGGNDDEDDDEDFFRDEL
mmetsp:Transcript_12796/g.11394  ORF Transcript_12796/g.11394 Transcript_12796/m.11394 type:complete len:190 (+) Transcript_12796:71-640(+)|eukprot:CAMPEP_0201577918 /NCGR_PEP_ID=MMETSP0190_2-20130828/24500_1 /ASSEMBLY_ACC=CAM_ASM_000263 /TAXON_ID=37353 /ORGANISM="Rosalina sp." /LENGTH=189 /DNA_ID=CAMNT_0048010477 /DNA_START=54 /DNA_END=623 /DNA_ORIENTATION=-